MLDRSIAPTFAKTQEVALKEAKTLKIHEVPVHLLRAGVQEVLKIEFVFSAGKKYETHNGVAYFTANMLKEGCSSLNSNEIAHIIDKYGAHLEVVSSLDLSKVSVYCLSKYVEELLPVLTQIIFTPTFPSDQLELQKEIEKQHLKIDLKKSKNLAQRAFRTTLYGDHPYGKSLHVQDIDAVTTEELVIHHKNHYRNFEIFISGNFNEDNILHLLNEYIPHSKGLFLAAAPLEIDYSPKKITEDLEGGLQASLRIGFPFIHKSHQDYIPFQILNHLFGGYFGSRLMKNIREDKGYTYGIYSSVSPLLQSSYFTIATDVVKESAEDAIAEILKEVKKLREEEVPLEELETVKNHIIGSFQADLTSPFALMDKYKSIYLYNLGYSYYSDFFDILEDTTVNDLQEIANKYLLEEQFTIVNIG